MTMSDLTLALIGGGLIGLSATLLMAFNGRIAGISGIFSGAVFAGGASERRWQLVFVLGLISASLLYGLMGEGVRVDVTGSPGLLVAGGVLVGFGTRLGSGCTSGHGVCGMSRLSPRSLVATLVFMTSGIATVSFMRIGLGIG